MWNESIPEDIRKQIEEDKFGLNIASFGGIPLKRSFEG